MSEPQPEPVWPPVDPIDPPDPEPTDPSVEPPWTGDPIQRGEVQELARDIA